MLVCATPAPRAFYDARVRVQGPGEKSNASKAPNNNKSGQSNKPVVKVAATEGVSTDKMDLTHLEALLTDKISKMEIELQKARARKPPNTPASSTPTSSTTAMKNPTRRLARWALEFQQYNCTIKYRKGSQNVVPDLLSRLYQDKESETVEIAAAGMAERTTDQ